MQHDVFISYTTHDKPTADAICHALEAQGVRCWIAPRDIPLGQNYAETLIQAINAAKLMVLIFSANTNNSRHVRNEIERAFNRDIPVIPFRIEDTPATGALEYFLSMPHWLDAFTPPLQQHLNSLGDSVRALLMAQSGLPKDTQVSGAAPIGLLSAQRNLWRIPLALTGVVIVLSAIGVGISRYRDSASGEHSSTIASVPTQAAQPMQLAPATQPPPIPTVAPTPTQASVPTVLSSQPTPAPQPTPTPAQSSPVEAVPQQPVTNPENAPQPSLKADTLSNRPAVAVQPTLAKLPKKIAAVALPPPNAQPKKPATTEVPTPDESLLEDIAWIGVSVDTVPDDIAKNLGPSDPQGTLARDVYPGAPAAKGGLKAGDVILAVDSKSVDKPGDLLRMLADTKPDQKLEMTIFRNGRKIDLPVTTAGALREAESGNAEAMLVLATVYTTGRHVPKDYVKALQWVRKAADLGNATALVDVGSFYGGGLGVPKDYVEAVRWYRQAADLGDPVAMYMVGSAYFSGKGVSTDYGEAMRWYRNSADLDNSASMASIGYLYDYGLGVPKDGESAARWYRKAADLGNTAGMYRVGYLYYSGQGVAVDYAEALRWFRKSADLGNSDSMVSVGVLYENGQGVPKDGDTAARWYRKAADLGNAAAKKWLGDHGY